MQMGYDVFRHHIQLDREIRGPHFMSLAFKNSNLPFSFHSNVTCTTYNLHAIHILINFLKRYRNFFVFTAQYTIYTSVTSGALWANKSRKIVVRMEYMFRFMRIRKKRWNKVAPCPPVFQQISASAILSVSFVRIEHNFFEVSASN